jgi:excisionase family DNA binding protein
LGVRAAEVAKMFDVSKTAIYKAFKSGQNPSVKIAGKIRIPRQAIEKLMADPAAGTKTA